MIKELYEFISQGGVLMIPIILGSVISLAIFLERLIFLREKNIVSEKLYDDLYDLIKENKLSEAKTLVKHENRQSLSILVNILLNNWHKDKQNLRDIADEKGKREVKKMENYISIISIIAVISPLMGLLGTVSGMITVFRQFIYSQQDPTFMSDGISKALITTAAGLIVAIPALLGSKYLYSRIDNLVLDLEDKLFNIIELKDESKK